MKLEVVTTGGDTATRPAPVLLVHGAWHGAWCWQWGFSEALAAAGYAVHAVSLRGHGGSEGRERLRWHSVANYVADVIRVAAALPSAPILIGHSMGGLVVQKAAERQPTPAAVLLAPVPTRGATGAALRVLRQTPGQFARVNLRLSLYPVVETPALAQRYLLSPATPPEIVAALHPRLQDESYRAFLDMMTSLPRPKRVRVPVQVLGGAADNLFPPPVIEATARAYGTTATIYPGMGHNMMIEPGWERVAADVVAWLTARGL